MRKFKDYVNYREQGLGNDGPFEPMQDEETVDLIKIVYNRYPEEFKCFLEQLSNRQDDHDLKELLKKIGGHNQSIDIYAHKKKDKRPEVCPPEADRAASETQD
jgi:hypothetical protein